jgi:Flp pilus assembly protein TadD
MSLLLQALQKAARNREGQAPAADAPPPAPEAAARPGADPLSMEPAPAFATRADPPLEELTLAEEDELFGPGDDALSQPGRPGGREPSLGMQDAPAQLKPAPEPRSAARKPDPSAQAATILRASEAREGGLVDWVRDRPVHAFAIAGGIFGVFYGAYVYLQIFHPALLRGDFLREKPPLQARTPPPAPARPLTPPETAPAAQAPAVPTSSAAGAAAPAGPAAAAASGKAGPLQAAPGVAFREPAGGTRAASGTTRSVRDALAESPEGDLAEVPAPAPKRKPRRAQVEVENVPLEDSVAVRGPDGRPAPSLGTLTRAWEAMQQGRYEQAQQLYDEVANAEPNNVDALLGLATVAGMRGNAEQSARLYGRALELDPRNPTAQAGLISLLGQADPQLSESRLKQLIAQEPSGFLYFALGNLYAKQNAWPQAQQAYYQAYQMHPDNPDYAYNLAVGLEHLGQGKIALNYYRRALELRSLRGRAEFDQQRVEERIGQLAARVGNQ